jgi:hypothetical protein
MLLADMQTEFDQVKSFLSQSNWMEIAKAESCQSVALSQEKAED